jgi:hypothetical protein
MEKYNRARAVEYAKKWAFDRNKAYFDYGKYGGDCTNFVSQCLRAGGAPMVDGIYGWNYYSANRHSASWTGVEFLYNFLTRATPKGGSGGGSIKGRVVSLEELEVGDIVQLSFDGHSFSHTLLVVEIGFGGEIFISAHDNDAFGRPLSTYSYKKVRGLHIE